MVSPESRQQENKPYTFLCCCYPRLYDDPLDAIGLLFCWELNVDPDLTNLLPGLFLGRSSNDSSDFTNRLAFSSLALANLLAFSATSCLFFILLVLGLYRIIERPIWSTAIDPVDSSSCSITSVSSPGQFPWIFSCYSIEMLVRRTWLMWEECWRKWKTKQKPNIHWILHPYFILAHELDQRKFHEKIITTVRHQMHRATQFQHHVLPTWASWTHDFLSLYYDGFNFMKNLNTYNYKMRFLHLGLIESVGIKNLLLAGSMNYKLWCPYQHW